MKKVYCLYRVSSKNVVEKNDIPMQRIECEKFAEEKGWYIAQEFVENGVSGFAVSGEKRDAIVNLKAAAKKKEFDVLLVFMFDRLGRKKDETPFIVEWFFKQGIEVWSVLEGEQRFDYHVDSLINYIRFWQAEGESLKTGERISTRMNQLADAGLFTGGHVPFGYKRVFQGRLNKKGQPVSDIAIDKNKAYIVRQIFEKTINEGLGSFLLAEWCNKQGIKTNSGCTFQCNTIKRILKNKIYCGYLKRGDASPYIPFLQIIDEALFEQVQFILKQRAEKDSEKRQISNSSKGKSLLSGNIFCGHCGMHMISSMYVDRYTRKDGSIYENRKLRYICYHRSKKLNDCDAQSAYVAHKIEPTVISAIRSILDIFQTVNSEETLQKYIALRISATISDRNKTQVKLKELTNAHTVLLRQVAASLTGDSTFNTETLRQAIIENERLSDELKTSFKNLSTDIMDTRHIEKMSEFYYQQMVNWKNNFELMSHKEKKMILCQLFCKVEVFYGYQLKIHIDRKYKLIFGEKISEINIENCQIE